MADWVQGSEKSEISGQDLEVQRPNRDIVRETAAKLYGQGLERKNIARMLVDHLVPNKHFDDGLERPLEQRLAQARTRLRAWEKDDAFRDMIWRLSVVKTDLAMPQILGGIVKKAKRGRVDAARLALEITGRHNPKGDSAPAQIIVAIEGVPRPMRVTSGDDHVVIDGDAALVEEDEDV